MCFSSSITSTSAFAPSASRPNVRVMVRTVAVGGDGLKNFCIDSPTAATELINEQRRDRAEFEIGGVEVGALLRHRCLALDSMTVFMADGDAMLVFDANRFDDAHQAIGDGPVDLRQVPVANLPARFGVNAEGRFLRETRSEEHTSALQ